MAWSRRQSSQLFGVDPWLYFGHDTFDKQDG